MTALKTALVRDPVLRRRLRKLYPELPSWVQRWVIATPERPLPLPTDYRHPAWASTATAHDALERTCEAVNATNPPRPWSIRSARHGQEQVEWAGPDGSEWDQPTLHPAAEGLLLRCALDPTFHAHRQVLLSTQREGGVLTLIGNDHERFDWVLRRGEAYGSSIIGESAVRQVGHAMIYGDGTCEHIFGQGPSAGGHIWPEQPAFPRVLTLSHAGAAEELLQRWRALPSSTDRNHIVQFWLGHQHPVLALAGMAAQAHLHGGPHHFEASRPVAPRHV
jgi:hypothetical protein